MLLFGGETLKDFAFAMAIGLIAGSYSSIAIATPLYAMWKTREPRYARLQKRYGTEVGLFEMEMKGAPALASVPVERLEKEAKTAEAQAQAINGSSAEEMAALRAKSEEAARRKVQENAEKKKAATSYRASETYISDAEMLEAAEEAARKAGRASERARKRSQRNQRK